ncbi:MAG: hypothetical protein MJ202_06135 [Lentisphaeria bacterium]|nr:hypothetical protein [Lentisphaeria bacterium]
MMNKAIATLLLCLGIFISLKAQQDSAFNGIGLDPKVLGAVIPAEAGKTSSNVSRCKGAYLRTEIRGSKSAYQLIPAIAIVGENRQPALQLKRLEVRTITEVRLYETLLRTFTPGQDNDHGTFDYQHLDDEIWEGESSQRVVSHEAGPLKDAEVFVNGEKLRTDANGVILDPENKLAILEKFDDLGKRSIEFLVEVQDYPAVSFPMTRTMPQRRDYDIKRIDEDDAHEMLLAYGMDFRLSKRQPEQDALKCSVSLPKDFAYAEAGKAFPVTITVTNEGQVQTSCLLARSFSRVPGLAGRLFYFGAIQPGETRSFTRLLTVDAAERSNTAFLELRFSDSWSPLKKRLPLTFTLIH